MKSNRSKKEDILRLRRQGLSYNQIAKKFKVTVSRVQQAVAPPPQIRAYIVKKAEGICQKCGLYIGKSGDVHHVGNGKDYEDYNDIDNLQLLCKSCHRKEHNGRASVRTCDCGGSMHKAGFGFSGRKLVQRWRCNICKKIIQRNNF